MPNVPKWMADVLEVTFFSKMPVFDIVATHWVAKDMRSVIFKGPLPRLNLKPGLAVSIRVSATAFRNYTPSFIDEEENIFQILAHIHGKGPGARFFENVQAGSRVAVSMAKGRHFTDAAPQYLLFGDESSLGLACALQMHFQSMGKRFYALLHLGKDQESLPDRLGLGSYELVERSSAAPVMHVPAFSIFDNRVIKDWAHAHFILAGNGLDIQKIKKELTVLGIKRRQIHTEPYWVPGKVGL